MLHCIALMIFIPTLTISIPYGTVSQAQLINIESASIWLYNQSSWSQCMCQALRDQSPAIVAFNHFFSNQTCQLIPNNFSLSAVFYLIPSVNSTIFILNQNLTSRLDSRCCSDISWVINQLQQSTTFRNYTFGQPVGLTLDTDLNMLIIIYGNITRLYIQRRELTVNLTVRDSSFVKSNAQAISYYKGLYYVGINRTNKTYSNYLYTYDTSFSTSDSMYLPKGNPQRAVWLYNNSIMCVIIQNGLNSSLAFLSWYSFSPGNFTYNQTISVPFNKPYGLAKSNDDTMIYVSGSLATIYQLSTTTFLWSILVSNENSTEIPMSLSVDSCGSRLWVLMLGFGIRIYDRINGHELAAWNISESYPTLYDMILTSDYELYLIDYSMNQLIHYGSSLTE